MKQDRLRRVIVLIKRKSKFIWGYETYNYYLSEGQILELLNYILFINCNITKKRG